MYPLSTEHAASEQLRDSLARFQYIAAELRDVLVSVCWITGICKFKKTEGEEGATAVSNRFFYLRLESRRRPRPLK